MTMFTVGEGQLTGGGEKQLNDRYRSLDRATASQAREEAQKIYSLIPLDRSGRQTRLLSINFQSSDCMLSGSLQVVSLEENPKYSALSYVWGNQNLRAPIYLDGIKTSVTQALAIALSQLHAEGKAQNIWVDAACINQTDPMEKAFQVQLMGDIYTNATITWIWLGPSDPQSDLAMDLVSNISLDAFRGFTPGSSTWPSWLALALLFKREWWSRMWIIQEAILSRNPIVKCGLKEAPLERFIDLKYFHDEARELDKDHFAVLRLFQNFPYQGLLWRNNHEWLNGPLSWWVPSTRNFKCQLFRDRVYALRALLEEESRRAIEVDYRKHPNSDAFIKSDRDVALEATVLLFRETGLTYLLFAGLTHGLDFRLPSWCPSWTQPVVYTPFTTLNFSAASLSETNLTSPSHWLHKKDTIDKYHGANFTEGNEILSVHGFIITAVKSVHVTPFIPFYEGTDAAILLQSKAKRSEVTREACLKWEQYVKKYNPDSYNEKPVEAFWRTIIANKKFKGEDAPDSFKDEFDAWMGRPLPPNSCHLTEEYAKSFRLPVVSRCLHRAFITTRDGRFGLAPNTAQIGDLVCLLYGGKVAYILQYSSLNTWEKPGTFVGEAYIHGIMDGEYLETVKQEDMVKFVLK